MIPGELKKFLFVGGPVHGKMLAVPKKPVIRMPHFVLESRDEGMARFSTAWENYMLFKVQFPYGPEEVYITATAGRLVIEDAYWKNWVELTMRGISDT